MFSISFLRVNFRLIWLSITFKIYTCIYKPLLTSFSAMNFKSCINWLMFVQPQICCKPRFRNMWFNCRHRQTLATKMIVQFILYLKFKTMMRSRKNGFNYIDKKFENTYVSLNFVSLFVFSLIPFCLYILIVFF